MKEKRSKEKTKESKKELENKILIILTGKYYHRNSGKEKCFNK